MRPRPLVTSFLMGFTSGTPLMVVLTLFQAWLKDGGVNLATIGALTMVGLPYSLKFLWSPWLDYLAPFGKRRQSWLLLSQCGLVLVFWLLSQTSPQDLRLVVILAFSVSFLSATQDIVVDAYRREDLNDDELTTGSALYMWGYRLGMLIVSGGGLILADKLGWSLVYKGVAALILIGPITLIFSPEPDLRIKRPANFKESVVEPLAEFFNRPHPWLILSFIFFFKFGEQLVTSLNTAFFMEAGYTKTQIGLVVKGFGTVATLVGVSLSGFLMKHRGLVSSLWLFGWLQMLNTACLTALWILPARLDYLSFFISLDHLIVGGSSAVFVAFLASLTNVNFTATQYALFSSLMALPRSLMASPSGWLVNHMGWPLFYLLGAILALPGLWLLYRLTSRGLYPPIGLAEEPKS